MYLNMALQEEPLWKFEASFMDGHSQICVVDKQLIETAFKNFYLDHMYDDAEMLKYVNEYIKYSAESIAQEYYINPKFMFLSE